LSLSLDVLTTLLCLGGLLLLFMALLSPLEALGWWAGWSRREVSPEPFGERQLAPLAASADVYLVYLTAIGGISAAELSSRERRFLSRFMEQLDRAVLVDDVFPFSVTNNPLNGERPLARLWQWIHDSRMRGKGGALAALIFVRNLLQVGVSADPRYGPIYNLGVAQEIMRSLLRRGYLPGSGAPIFVMGWSGGGQIAVGVSRYLHRSLAAPVYVISIGGVLSSDPGVSDVAHLFHLQGSIDRFPLVGDILYPGRWPWLRYSPWNQAKRAGRITVIDSGPMRHTGRGDYFDSHTLLPDGVSHLDKTTAIIAGIIRDTSPPPS
jgi:hypothetical protein